MTFHGVYSAGPDAWTQRVPEFAQRILIVGCDAEKLAAELQDRSHAEVDCADDLTAAPPCPDTGFDAVILYGVAQAAPSLEDVAPLLAPDGYVLFAVENQSYWHRGGEAPHDTTVREAERAADAAGLAIYNSWPDMDPAATDEKCDAEGCIHLEGRRVPVKTESDRMLLAVEFLFSAVRPNYNPLVHSRTLIKAGHPGWAYDVLACTPPVYHEDWKISASIAAERQLCLLAWAKNSKPQRVLELFYASQALFYEAVCKAPETHLAYHCQAEFWRLLGDGCMADRLMRSLERFAPQDGAEPQAAARELETIRRPVPEETAPSPKASGRRLRILLIPPTRPHYGPDVLYDGLCTLLGPENVVDYPWKPTLHGVSPKDLANYPCSFNRPGEPLDTDELLRQLRAGQFDVILFGDFDLSIEASAAKSILEAGGSTPVFLLDQQDDPIDNRPRILEFLGLEAAPYFKREMLACFDYGKHAYPLPFAYADERAPGEVPLERSAPLFWAGHRQFGLRRPYLERLEKVFQMNLRTSYTQEKYTQALLESRVGLNIFGFGFDTVRYWEVPAHGCMLLSERLPIRIPHNFRDGESAVFFDDLEELEAKVAHYLGHPDEAIRIAQAGREHLLKHHTGSARAAQMLGWIVEELEAR